MKKVMLVTIGMFHMTLGDYDYGMLGSTPYPKMAKVVFVLFQETMNGFVVLKNIHRFISRK
jgi:hypothetical protein